MPKPDPKEMSFLEHLDELRVRLIRIFCGIFVMSVAAFYYSTVIFAFITAPLIDGPLRATLIGTGPAEAFIVKLKVALAAGFLLSLPYSFSQIWAFVSPGLHQEEKKYAGPFIFFSTFFFLLGVWFCYELVFPFAFQFFLAEYQSIATSPSIRIGEYLSFVLKLLLVFGLVFEMPVLTFFLARLGLISHRWLISNSRYAIVAIFIIAALLTPPDVITQCLLAAPLTLLYAICIGVAYFFNPAQCRKQ